ncbi:MAG: class II fructose-bisphosphate aldolase [Verrucomicrobiae bacterium]|nr:class II fructose-bisphosphate aldolase [Verrucomicrobiae bacterium]
MLLDPLQSRIVLRTALEGGFALLAVNADSPAAITDVLEAARTLDAPVMIEASLWQLTGHSFGAGDALLGMARYLVQLAVLAESPRYRDLPILFHTDHIKGPVTLPLLEAAVRGLATGLGDTVVSPSTLSVDSSERSEADNIAALVRLGGVAADCGRPVTLEMEAGVDDGVTDLETAGCLLAGVESRVPGVIHLWAPGVGTRHGLGEQTGLSVEAVRAHRVRASDVLGRPVGIALHGSSGVSPEALRAAVEAGVVKVNWSSESLRLRSAAALAFYEGQRAALEPGHPAWKATAMDHAVQSHVASGYQPRVMERLRCLNAAGRAADCRRALATAG